MASPGAVQIYTDVSLCCLCQAHLSGPDGYVGPHKQQQQLFRGPAPKVFTSWTISGNQTAATTRRKQKSTGGVGGMQPGERRAAFLGGNC